MKKRTVFLRQNIWQRLEVKLPVHRTGLPGDEISFILRPFTPPIPPKRDGALAGQVSKWNFLT
jgi:hypothetical protein